MEKEIEELRTEVSELQILCCLAIGMNAGSIIGLFLAFHI